MISGIAGGIVLILSVPYAFYAASQLGGVPIEQIISAAGPLATPNVWGGSMLIIYGILSGIKITKGCGVWMIITGLLAIFVSFLSLGGFVGAIGGILGCVGGVNALAQVLPEEEVAKRAGKKIPRIYWIDGFIIPGSIIADFIASALIVHYTIAPTTFPDPGTMYAFFCILIIGIILISIGIIIGIYKSRTKGESQGQSVPSNFQLPSQNISPDTSEQVEYQEARSSIRDENRETSSESAIKPVSGVMEDMDQAVEELKMDSETQVSDACPRCGGPLHETLTVDKKTGKHVKICEKCRMLV